MRFRRGAQLDSSQVSDRRGMGGAGAVVGGGGIVGIVIFVLVSVLGGGGGGGLNPGDLGLNGPLDLGNGSGEAGQLSETCKTGADANQADDCRIVAVVNSVQAYWKDTLDGYQEVDTVFFSGGTNTGCGQASSATGPFYCPPDSLVYIDLSFYDELRTRFGASGGPFAEAYVIAHEYGHHVQDLQGILDRSRDGETGPNSAGVKVELMADCYAGMWAAGALDTGLIDQLTDQDIADGLDAAAAVGDDRIQEKVQGRVDPEAFTHGSSEQRKAWFSKGLKQASIEACDTFAG